MTTIIAAFVFILGVIFGSFYNVIIYRVPLDISIAKGRSFCPKCNTKLKAIDLIPVFSQLFLKSRCRYCKEKISIRYPIIELLTGVLFLIAFLLHGISWETLLYFSFWSMLLVTTMIDFDHMIVVDWILIGFSVTTVAYVIFSGTDYIDHLLGLGVGFGVFLIIYLTAKLIYGKEAFGFGDVTLMAAIGLVLGFRNTILTFLLSFIVGAIGILIMRIVGRKVEMKQEIPFGPYICIAAFIASIFGNTMINWYLGMF